MRRLLADLWAAFVAARDAAYEVLNPEHHCDDETCTEDHR